jgi:hypothetical protein
MTTPLEPPLDPGLGLSQPEPAVIPGEPRPSPRPRRRRALFVALIALGAVLIAGGGAALVRELTRSATPAEAAAALQQEIATRWERLPAGKIFPATIIYPDSENNSMFARLVGIAPPASCRTALGAGGFANLRHLGCTTILRATYVDASGALATTVGVAVLKSPSAGRQAALIADSQGLSDGLHVVTFGGTTAAQFGDAARGLQGGLAAGSYILRYTVGFTDGQPGVAAQQQDALLANFGDGVSTGLRVALIEHGNPCEMKDIKC